MLKIDTHAHISKNGMVKKCSKDGMGGQKSKCDDYFKYIVTGFKRCKMMRGFQIWPRNSNGIEFAPLPFWQKRNCQKLAICRIPTENGKLNPRTFPWYSRIKIIEFPGLWPEYLEKNQIQTSQLHPFYYTVQSSSVRLQYIYALGEFASSTDR